VSLCRCTTKFENKFGMLSHLLCSYVTGNSGCCLPSISFIIQAWLICLSLYLPVCNCMCLCGCRTVSVNPYVVLLHFSQFHHYHLPQNLPLWALLNPLKEKKRQRTKEKVSSWGGWHKPVYDNQNNDRRFMEMDQTWRPQSDCSDWLVILLLGIRSANYRLSYLSVLESACFLRIYNELQSAFSYANTISRENRNADR